MNQKNSSGQLMAVAPVASLLRQRQWRRFLSGPDPALLDELYVPALAAAVRYDRCCAYFSSSVLAAAARGFGKFIERLMVAGEKAARPAVRLLVNEELSREDVRALMETGDLSRLEQQLRKRFKKPQEVLEKDRLAMLAWLAKNNYLEIRIGLMRFGEGILHAKFGIMTDGAGDAVVFSGSGNETAQGLMANYERLELSTSWEDPERHALYRDEFNRLWNDSHPDIHTVSLPEAIRLKLIKYAPKEAPTMEPATALQRQKAAMIWQFILEAPYLPNGEAACDETAMVKLWPHQRSVVEETSRAWPAGRLLCDEVGMGKTIEAILILRRLLAGRGVKRVLILLPAGLLKQWQAELREKGGLIFPRLEGTNHLVFPDNSVKKLHEFSEALKEERLLLSRELARLESNLSLPLQADPWDLVILDEAHAARRKKQEEGEFNSATLLLNLMRQLQLRGKARSFLLLSATPMQTQPWEPWDLLAVLGEGGRWLVDFHDVRNFYNAIAAVRTGTLELSMARQLAELIIADNAFPALNGNVHYSDPSELANDIWFRASSDAQQLVRWLREGTPLSRRMHRNTRNTLKRYYELGLIDSRPPERKIHDDIFDYETEAERCVYDSIKDYIDKRFEELEREKAGKGFVMTVYRRRAASSPHAFKQSLERRRQGLQQVIKRYAYEESLPIEDVPDRIDADDLPEGDRSEKIPACYPQDPAAAEEELHQIENLLEQLENLQGRDTKRDRFFKILRKITEDGRSVLVFTEYVDTMNYLRDTLTPFFGYRLGCFSGDGGQILENDNWVEVTKNRITELLAEKKLSILICTDAASEGLNLQAAGALINYDLPWNPSRVEQRIGRIDRIGQRHATVKIVNMYIKDSIDERVYSVLRKRCGLFEHFVGPMQPVLSAARRILLGREKEDLELLDRIASEVERSPVTMETYLENEKKSLKSSDAPIDRSSLHAALQYLTESLGFKISQKNSSYQLAFPTRNKISVGFTSESLEQDNKLIPFCPLHQEFKNIAQQLFRSGERLPLVIRSFQNGPFRRSIAYWVSSKTLSEVKNFNDLRQLIEDWNGDYPEPGVWNEINQKALKIAEEQVVGMKKNAEKIVQNGLQLQIESARWRLMRELGRYLVCVNQDVSLLNDTLSKQMSRDIASSERLKRCIDRLGGYPLWPDWLQEELKIFAQNLRENIKKARLLGSEIDAALDDPRWAVNFILKIEEV